MRQGGSSGGREAVPEAKFEAARQFRTHLPSNEVIFLGKEAFREAIPGASGNTFSHRTGAPPTTHLPRYEAAARQILKGARVVARAA